MLTKKKKKNKQEKRIYKEEIKGNVNNKESKGKIKNILILLIIVLPLAF